MAFRTGSHVASLAERLSPPADKSEPWTYILHGVSEDEAKAALAKFHAEQGIPTHYERKFSHIVAETADGVDFAFADGTTASAALLIGADGIHSATRRNFYPDEGHPIFAGMILWRGMTFAKAFLTGGTMAFAGYKEQKFIA